MKPLLIFSIFFLFSCKPSIQVVTYKDIIGNWQMVSPNNQPLSTKWTFTDKSHYYWYEDNKEFARFTYTLDTVSNFSMMKYVGKRDEDSLKLDALLFLKKIDDNTIKWQSPDNNSISIKWNNDENYTNTVTMKRIK